jgi:hypothetical protein
MPRPARRMDIVCARFRFRHIYYHNPVKAVNNSGLGLRCALRRTLEFRGGFAEDSLGMLLYATVLMSASLR